jgi:predicted neuraminidase
MLFYKVGPGPRQWWGMLMTSSDHGRTWSKPRKLGTGPLGHLIGPEKNKPIQLDDDSILCPSSIRRQVHFERTRDLGRTWDVIGPVEDGEDLGGFQPSILTHGGGTMQVLCRSKRMITQSWSNDGGRTWSEITATELPNPDAGTDAVTLRDGRQLLVYNHTVREEAFPSGRDMLNVAISSRGRHWRPVLTLERADIRYGYSYPAVIQSSDGKVHVTYTYLRQSIKHVVLDPRQIQ